MYKDLTLDPGDELANLTDRDDVEQEHINDNGSVDSIVTSQRNEIAGERNDVADESNEAPDESRPINVPAPTPAPTAVSIQEEPAYQPRPKIARLRTDKPVEIGYRSVIVDKRRQEGGVKRAKYDQCRWCIETSLTRHLTRVIV